MIAYKLTDQNMQTYNKTQWQIGEWKETNGSGNLCSSGWLHYYSDPLLAVFLNPVHAGFEKPRLFEIEVEGSLRFDFGLKFGCTKMKLTKELKLPAVTLEQRIKFAIYCALEVTADTAFIKWAKAWLDRTDRSYDAAAEAAAAATRAADAAYCATRAAAEAARAANVTYYAAYAATRAAAGAAYYAAAAGGAADAAFYAADAAAEAIGVKPIDLIKIAQKAIETN